MSSLKVTDQESAAVAVAPRVALADIESAIDACYFFSASDAVQATKPERMPLHPALGLLTVCMIVMRNGFVVVGKSAPAAAANFNPELGRKFAYEDAVRQLWPLMGFALRDRLAAAS